MNPLNNAIVGFVRLLPKSVVFVFAKKYIAGTHIKDAIEVVQDLNSKGILATMDVLGESITNKKEAEIAKKQCLEVLEEIEKNKLDANLSIKPTQLGLGIDKEFCYQNVLELVRKAKDYNNFVRIDMEDSPYTDLTIELYRKVKKDFPNVGIVVQAYLKRTFDDVSELNKEGGHYRLCKGIYIEPEEIAYKERQAVRDNFMKTLRRMFEDGNYVGIATHDDYLVEESYKIINEMKLSKDKYEFQMLYGVKEKLRNKINADGHKIRVYVPFGEQWYPYSIRRLQENPNMAWYITKSLFTFK